jgi:Xaa-Pro aminopeptidase
MQDKLQSLKQAESLAWQLFREIEERGLIQPGITESALNAAIYALAAETLGIKKFWHKRIVRAGENTLKPYDENPPDLIIQLDDILFLDFGPVFEDWEADIGKTYVLGNNPDKLRLKTDIETAWHQAKAWFEARASVTGAELYAYVDQIARGMGWEQGSDMAGHNIGHFPHERLHPGDYGLYIHKENHTDMKKPSAHGSMPHWILEIHFVDREKKIGGFFEQLLG